MADNEKNDEMRVGDPLYRAVKADGEDDRIEKAVETVENTAGCHREGDFGVGIPAFVPEDARRLDDQEQKELEQKLEEELREEFSEKLKAMESGNDKWAIPVKLRRLISWGLLATGSVLGLILISQGVRFANDIRQLPKPFNWTAGIAAGIFGVIITVIILKIFWQLIKLNRKPTISIKAITVLEKREGFRRLVRERSEEVRGQLEKYLRDYPIDGVGRKKLITLGMSAEQTVELGKAREYLLDSKVPREAEEWLTEYQVRFQVILDKLAEKRVRQYAIKAGTGTAMSPVAIIDQSIILYSSSAMIKDLLYIYQLRPAFGQTGIILARAIVNIYLSGMIEETAGKAAESLSEPVSEWSSHLGGLLGSSLGRTISVKTTEAALNALLISRLGKRTIRELSLG